MTKDKPKIVFINRFFFPDEPATAQILTDLAGHLQNVGFRVCVVTSRHCLEGASALPNRETVLGGVEASRVRSIKWGGRSVLGKLIQFSFFYPAAFVELVRILSPGDIVVAKTDPPLISTVAQLAARVRGALLVNWLQDLYPEVAAELQTPIVRGRLGAWLRSIRNLALKRAVANVVIGEVMAERLRQEGVDQERIKVIPNWADEEKLRPIKIGDSSARKAWGFAPGDFVIAYSGNLGRAHESATLIEAAVLLAHRTDIKFLSIGGGHGHSRLESAVRERNLASFIFQPHQPRERLQDTLAAADAHWLSLRPELEGLIVPSKLYGILAAGRPLVAIAAAEGEVARVVKEHQCGFSVEPGDAPGLARRIIELADDPALRHSLGQRAREVSERVFPKASALASWTDLLLSLQEHRVTDESGIGSRAQKHVQTEALAA